jgi:hypothetical protein
MRFFLFFMKIQRFYLLPSQEGPLPFLCKSMGFPCYPPSKAHFNAVAQVGERIGSEFMKKKGLAKKGARHSCMHYFT